MADPKTSVGVPQQPSNVPIDTKDLIFWIRSELFDYGLLPLSPHSDISFASLLSLVRKYRYTHELNAQYMKAINTLYVNNSTHENVTMRYSEWEIIASEDLLLNPVQTRLYFQRFCDVRNNLSGTQPRTRKTTCLETCEVNFYEFIIFLYIQLVSQPSLGFSYTKGSYWPTSTPTVSQSSAEYSTRENKDGSLLSSRSRVEKKRRAGETSSARSAASAVSNEPAAISPSVTGIIGTQSPPRYASPPNLRSEAASSPPRSFNSPITPMSARQSVKRSSMALLTKNPTFFDLRSRLKSNTFVPLKTQLTFVSEHLGLILRLLCGDDSQHLIRRSELEPLNFLLAVGYSEYVVHESNLIDVLPKAATTEKYSNFDLTEWILLRLKVNQHLYAIERPSNAVSINNSNNNNSNNNEFNLAIQHFNPKSIVYRPITLVSAHSRTLLRTDPDSIPAARGLTQSIHSVKDPHTSSSFSGSLPSISANTSLSFDGFSITGSPNDPVDSRFARILNCNSSYIYLLCPVSCIKIEHCIGSVIVVGAVGSLISIENCKDTTIITACKSIQIVDCDSCTFYLMTAEQPILLGNNYGLRFGPYCTHYRSLERHVSEVGLDTSNNLWNRPIIYASELLRDYQPDIPSGNLRHPMRSAPTKLEKMTYTLVQPDNFSPFRVPFELHETKQIPFPLPSDYQLALEDHTEEAILLKKELDRLIQDKKQQGQIQLLVRTQFEKWLADTGAMQQVEDLVKMQIQ